jgi:nicotinamide riboside kinase
MDLGDPRESLVSLKDHATWEADNRVEERWQWGAQILDLCNLSPEEYKNSTAVTVKTIQDCGECGGGGGSQVEEDKGNGTINNDGEFTVTFESPVASKVYVFVTFTDDQGNEYSFMTSVDKGSDTATYDISSLSTFPPFEITSVEVGLKEDGSDAGETVKDKKYEYSVDYSGESSDGKTYVFSILCTKTDSLTADDYQAIIDAQGQGFDDFLASYDEINFGGVDTAQAIFIAPCSHSEEWMPEPVEDQFFAEHSYDFVFLTQKTITEIREDFTTDTEHWVEDSITMGGKKYEKWMRRDLSGAQCPYSIGDDPCEEYELPFILKIKK